MKITAKGQFAAEYLNIEIPLPNEKLTLNL